DRARAGVRRRRLRVLSVRGGHGPFCPPVVLGEPRRLQPLLVLARDAADPREGGGAARAARPAGVGSRHRPSLALLERTRRSSSSLGCPGTTTCSPPSSASGRIRAG